jgi:hypothetical protein
MAHSCGYCTLHQVKGCTGWGQAGKLMQMKKDDSALTPRELTAVLFARKLTTDPASVTDADFAQLKEQFGGKRRLRRLAADLHLLLHEPFAACGTFEDEAVRIYRET